MQPLTESQKDIIKASIPFLEESGTDLTFGFYDHMFHTHPEVLPYFNPSHHTSRRQPRILAHALLQYAKNIDDLTPLTSFVNHVVSKHVGLQVKAEHYAVVGECLLYQIHKDLGDEIATPEFLKAWEVAYTNLAEILIDAERATYESKLLKPNGWNGFKPFKVSQIKQESSDVKSIWFEPQDFKLVVPEPGQYICIRLTPKTNIVTQREYTLSDNCDGKNFYKISVRHDPNGVASTYIHQNLKQGDIVDIGQPNGELVYVDNGKSSNLVLIAGGIGITPMIPILEYGLEKGRNVRLYWSNKTVKSLPFIKFFQFLQRQYPETFQIHIFITADDEDDCKDDSYIYRRVQELDFNQVEPNDNIFLVGPQPFTKFVTLSLSIQGVDIDKISTEEYGPMTV